MHGESTNIYTLLLPEGQNSEGWGPSIKQRSFENLRALDGK
jgi:hypothetical protein